MYNRRLTTMLALLGATAGMATYAATANAVVVDNKTFSLASEENDFNGGNVAFDFNDGVMKPTTTGTLVIENGDDTCARVVVDHYDGTTLLGSDPGISRCVTDDLRHEWSADRHLFSDPLIDRVVVRVEKETLSGWSTQDEEEVIMQEAHDLVSVQEQGIDIGNDGWGGSAPLFPATMDWSIEDGIVEAAFVGANLHLDNFATVCARVKIRYLTNAGAFVDSEASDMECAPDNDHYNYPVDITYSSPTIGLAEVIAETRGGGRWNNAGSTVVSIAE